MDEALKLKNSDIANHLSLPPVKKHCRCGHMMQLPAASARGHGTARAAAARSLLAEDALKAAVGNYYKKNDREMPTAAAARS